MFHMRTASGHSVEAVARARTGFDARTGGATDPQRAAADRMLDEVLEDSFPASDPPSWTPGIARVIEPADDLQRES